jgi:galactose mutarotase-like enzyme
MENNHRYLQSVTLIMKMMSQKFFCYEPVSHMVDGFNMAEIGVKDTGVIYLDPGESYKAVWTFSIFEE